MIHLLRNLTRPGYLSVIATKIKYRLRGRSQAQRLALSWYQQQARTLEQVGGRLHQPLLAESIAHDQQQNERARAILASLPVKLGGGGFCTLLYYLIRQSRPAVVVETGVAAGFSSQSILTALNKNGTGTLYSSDFPYFRLENPEQYIGLLVEPELRAHWHLYIQGDERNLLQIGRDLAGRKVDLFHYDSDKSVPGRNRALALMAPHLAADCLIVFDDVNDNEHFQQWVAKEKPAFRLFQWNRKLIGVACFDARKLNDLLPS